MGCQNIPPGPPYLSARLQDACARVDCWSLPYSLRILSKLADLVLANQTLNVKKVFKPHLQPVR